VTLTVYSPEHIIASPRQQVVDWTNNSTNPLLFTYGGTVHPGWYGALGDGTADDDTPIDLAIDGVTANTAGIVEFQSGSTYSVTTINLNSNVTLIGYGATIKNAASNQDAVIQGTDVSNIKIIGLTIDGNDANVTTSGDVFGIYIDISSGASNVTIKDCKFQNTEKDAIYLDGVHEVLITNNHFTDCAQQGSNDVIKIHGSSYEVQILGNYIYNVNDAGALINVTQNSAYVLVSNNICWGGGSSGDGITIKNDADALKHVIVSNNILMGSINHGIHTAGQYFSITGNVIDNPTYTGIIHYGNTDNETSNQFSITGNVIKDPGSRGIWLVDSRHGTVASNTIYSPGGDGIRIEDNGANKFSRSVTITGNSIDSAGSAGIRCLGIQESVISSNLIQDSTGEGIILQDDSQGVDSQYNVVSNNYISGSGDIGIEETDAAEYNVIANNLIRSSTGDDISVVDNETVVKDNYTPDAVDTVASVAGTITLPPNGVYIEVTGTQTITNITSSWQGRIVVLRAKGALTIEDGNNVVLAGGVDWTPADGDTLTLVSTGHNASSDWHEVARADNTP